EASVQYYLKEQLDTITFEILDANDNLIDTFTGSKPKYKVDKNIPWWQRGGSSKPTTAKGMNTFTWDLRYPGATDFEGMIIWSARPTRGPKAPIGNYKVKIKSGDYEKTYPFAIHMNPNLKGITKEDLDEQFELANNIMQKTSAANEAVIHIREIKKQLKEHESRLSSSTMKRTISPFLSKISVIEENLYQVKNQSGQDPLNFPIKLNNRLASLRRSMENGDAKPTDGAYKVFQELSAELETELNNLNAILKKEGAKVNKALQDIGAENIKTAK
ncbi:MAG: glycosyl hydrolase, partial [Bacteroidota bacterium]